MQTLNDLHKATCQAAVQSRNEENHEKLNPNSRLTDRDSNRERFVRRWDALPPCYPLRSQILFPTVPLLQHEQKQRLLVRQVHQQSPEEHQIPSNLELGSAGCSHDESESGRIVSNRSPAEQPVGIKPSSHNEWGYAAGVFVRKRISLFSWVNVKVVVKLYTFLL
jgi:hypothetical protein